MMSRVAKILYSQYLYDIPSIEGTVVVVTFAISAYHHWCCEFKSRSWRGVFDTWAYAEV